MAQRRQSIGGVSREVPCFLKLGDRLCIHLFLLIDSAQVDMGRIKMRIHLERLSQLLDGLIVPPREVENLSIVSINWQRKRVKLQCLRDLDHGLVQPSYHQ